MYRTEKIELTTSRPKTKRLTDYQHAHHICFLLCTHGKCYILLQHSFLNTRYVHVWPQGAYAGAQRGEFFSHRRRARTTLCNSHMMQSTIAHEMAERVQAEVAHTKKNRWTSWQRLLFTVLI